IGAAAKVPQERKRTVIVRVATGPGEGDALPYGDRDVSTWARNTAVGWIIHRDDTHRRAGVNMPGCISAGEGDGEAPYGREGDGAGVLYGGGGSHAAEIPGDRKGLVSYRIHTVTLHGDRCIGADDEVRRWRINDTPGRSGVSAECLRSNQGVDHAK